MARKKSADRTPGPNASSGTSLVPIALAATIAEVPAGKVRPAAFREPGVTMAVGRPYTASSVTIVADAVFHVDAAKPDGDGPWLGEADKIAWRDPETGYEAIILRDPSRGHLGGYVGVPVSHPLHGFEHGAVPVELGIDVHGGLSYSRICEEGPTPSRRRLADEARRICHAVARPPRYAPIEKATDYQVEDAHAWWFGFQCDKPYDVVPGDIATGRRFMVPETGAVYRDEGYVMNEVRNLARQLRAVADGLPMPCREGPPLPPIGLDPDQVGRR